MSWRRSNVTGLNRWFFSIRKISLVNHSPAALVQIIWPHSLGHLHVGLVESFRSTLPV